MTTNFGLAAGTVVTNGRALDAIAQSGIGGVSLSGDGIVSSASDAAGAFSVIAGASQVDPRLVIFTAPNIVERRTNVRVPGGDISVSLIPSSFDLRAFDEMFRVPMLLRWTTAPPLLVENRALAFTNINATDQTSLADQMTDAEFNALVTDLSWALPQLTGGTFGSFASITRQMSPEGVPVHILNTGVITVARVVGLTASTGYWGYSRWQFRSDGTITGGIVTLDRDFERGVSVVPPLAPLARAGTRAGLQPRHGPAFGDEFGGDDRAERVRPRCLPDRVQRTPGNRSPDNDPSFWSTNAVSGDAHLESSDSIAPCTSHPARCTQHAAPCTPHQHVAPSTEHRAPLVSYNSPPRFVSMHSFPVMKRLLLGLALAATPVMLLADQSKQTPKPGKALTEADLATAKPGRDPNQPIDEEYTKKIKEYTTETVLPVAARRLHAGVARPCRRRRPCSATSPARPASCRTRRRSTTTCGCSRSRRRA